MSRSGAALLAAAAAVGVLLAAERSRDLRPMADRLQGRTVPAAALGSGDTRRILQTLGALHPVPDGFGPARSFSADAIPDERLAAVLRVDPRWLHRPVAIVSLLVRPEDLETLQSHSEERGRAWEKPAFLAYVENGRLLFADNVGVRIHGGWTRRYPEAASYRVYFRRRYGRDRFTVPVFPGRADRPPRQLVVRNDGGVTRFGDVRQFLSPMAYEITRRIGCPAPQTRPVVLFLNGEARGVKSLSEWIHRDFLAARYGHGDFFLARTKPKAVAKVGDPEQLRRFDRWARKSARDLVEIARIVDVDNLSRWFLAVVFCGTQDALQGALVRDRTVPDSRWFWIAWDMDQSFGFPNSPGSWVGSPFRAVLGHSDARSRLLTRLIEHSPEYRAYLAELAAEVLDQRLTPEFLGDLLDRYRGWAADYGLADEVGASLDAVERFLIERRPILRRELGALLGREVSAGGRPGTLPPSEIQGGSR